MHLALLAALCLALAACSADPILTLPDVVAADTGPAQVCTPGAQVACTCVGGATGAQVCSSDGRSLGACECPDAGGGADAGSDAGVIDSGPRDTGTVDAGPGDVGQPDAGGGDVGADVVDAGSNPGTRYQACRVIGAPCSDGSTCLRTMGAGTSSSPQGLCSRRCDVDSECDGYAPPGGDPATVRCIYNATTEGHCAVRCASSSCPASTRCYTVSVIFKPGLSPYCQPQTDP